ncbi:T9SS type A sorting domain-containing protein, partial [bacterium]|nr:T9SS type A sorting domain-containing protein [bacterium]
SPPWSAARPNPCAPRTTVDYSLPRAGAVSLTVHDIAGRLVRTLVRGERAAGTYSAEWEGSDARGLPAAAGTYFLRLRSAGGAAARRVVLLQ